MSRKTLYAALLLIVALPALSASKPTITTSAQAINRAKQFAQDVGWRIKPEIPWEAVRITSERSWRVSAGEQGNKAHTRQLGFTIDETTGLIRVARNDMLIKNLKPLSRPNLSPNETLGRAKGYVLQAGGSMSEMKLTGNGEDWGTTQAMHPEPWRIVYDRVHKNVNFLNQWLSIELDQKDGALLAIRIQNTAPLPTDGKLKVTYKQAGDIASAFLHEKHHVTGAIVHSVNLMIYPVPNNGKPPEESRYVWMVSLMIKQDYAMIGVDARSGKVLFKGGYTSGMFP